MTIQKAQKVTYRHMTGRQQGRHANIGTLTHVIIHEQPMTQWSSSTFVSRGANNIKDNSWEPEKEFDPLQIMSIFKSQEDLQAALTRECLLDDVLPRDPKSMIFPWDQLQL